MRRLLFFVPLALVGCGSTGMTQAEIDHAKTAKFDDAARAKVAAGMAAGARAQKAQESAWAAKQDPAKLAEINRARAEMGRPPLGGN